MAWAEGLVCYKEPRNRLPLPGIATRYLRRPAYGLVTEPSAGQTTCLWQST